MDWFSACLLTKGEAPWTCEGYDEGCTSVQELTSSWVPAAGVSGIEATMYQEGTGDLDECNGRTVDGAFRYHMTLGFPYSLGCYLAERENQAWNTQIDTPPDP